MEHAVLYQHIKAPLSFAFCQSIPRAAMELSKVLQSLLLLAIYSAQSVLSTFTTLGWSSQCLLSSPRGQQAAGLKHVASHLEIFQWTSEQPWRTFPPFLCIYNWFWCHSFASEMGEKHAEKWAQFPDRIKHGRPIWKKINTGSNPCKYFAFFFSAVLFDVAFLYLCVTVILFISQFGCAVEENQIVRMVNTLC